MKNCIVKNLKESVDADVQVMSSIKIKGNRGTNTTMYFTWAVAIDDAQDKTFVRATDSLTRFNVGQGVNQAKLTDNVLWYAMPGVEYPKVVEVEVFPRYNLKKVYVNNFDGIDKYMVNLEEIRLQSYTTPLDESSTRANIEKLNDIPSLKTVYLNPDKVYEYIIGDVGKLGNLVNLTYFNYYQSGIFGDLAESLDAMVENGRTSGELSFRGYGTKVVLTYNNTTVRIGSSTATHQTGDVYGWRIVFDVNGWNVAETYTTVA